MDLSSEKLCLLLCHLSTGFRRSAGPISDAIARTSASRFRTDRPLENYIKVRETFRFKGDHDTYTGEATAQMLDLNMNVLGQFNATTRATRVKAQ